MKDHNSLAIYSRLLAYLGPFWKKAILLFVTTVLFAALSGVSLTLIPPFLNILFQDGNAGVSAGAAGNAHSVLVPGAVEKRIDGVRDRARDFIYEGSGKERLARFCVIFLVLMLLKNILGYARTVLTISMEQSILKRIRDELYGKIQMLPLSFFDGQKTGHLISRVTNDVTSLRGAVVGGLASIVQNSLMTVIAAAIIFYTSWKLALLTIVLVPLNIGLISMISRKLRKGSRKAQESMADMTSVLQESISGVRVVKAFGMEGFEKGKFDLFNARYLREYLRMRKFAELASPASETIGMLASVIILWYGGKLVIASELEPENLMMFLVAMLWVVGPVRNLSKLNSVVQEGLASGERVFQILDIRAEGEESGEIPIDGVREGIVYDKVSFSYENGIEVLRDVDLAIARGEVVALVGPSGAGKSTLADLLPRFYIPTSGRILIDGRDTATLELSSLRALMGIVTQETILFNDTVFNNIAYGMRDCEMERVVEAAKAANAHEFISLMPSGYDTMIGDRGTQLSGGQKQRLAIARAVLKNPQILILDEATSSLDVESEALVQEAVDRLVKGRTTLVIAHRLSTVRNADRIIVVENGRIHQAGTHEELIVEEGIYRKLYRLQVGA
ncbi:MAG: ABC transporter ATP-binding protein/permease [Candidatus Krumholzibacteria bacterium]|nr:ABC transporter ATP-binding protein/permease [Candidatus Krumholzibacteria bacterium]